MEFIRCTDVKQTKKTSELSGDIIRWEKRLNDLQGTNKDDFTVGLAHRMKIPKNMLPTELAGLVKGKQAKSSLMTFDLLLTYVVNQSRLAFGLEQGAAPDIMLNLVDHDGAITPSAYSQQPAQPNTYAAAVQQSTGPVQYTSNECELWVMEEEGWNFHTTNPEDQQISQAVLSIIRQGKGGKLGGGKGKGGGKAGGGKGKGNSKGKGGKGSGFQGECYNCGVVGHNKNNCPQPKQGKGSVHLTENTKTAFVLTQEPMDDFMVEPVYPELAVVESPPPSSTFSRRPERKTFFTKPKCCNNLFCALDDQ